MIAIVDYGLGNVQAFVNLYKRIGIEIVAARSADELVRASRLILPGVGSFDHAIELLEASGMRSTLDELVLKKGVPVLGVCVGMQIMADSSDEGSRCGLGWIPGEVKALKPALETSGQRLPLPHMGWNDVRPTAGNPLFKGLEQEARFYFLHSFYFTCADAGAAGATCEYGLEFACAVRSGRIHGVQFHPEKSHHFGSELLKNFASI
jgi:glutamine amidotransferase